MDSLINMAVIFCGFLSIGFAFIVLMYRIFKEDDSSFMNKLGSNGFVMVFILALLCTPLSVITGLKSAIPEKEYSIPTTLTVEDRTFTDVYASVEFDSRAAYSDVPAGAEETLENIFDIVASTPDEAFDVNEIAECFVLKEYTCDGFEFTALPRLLTSSRSYDVSLTEDGVEKTGKITVGKLVYDGMGITTSERWHSFSTATLIFYAVVMIAAAYDLYLYFRLQAEKAKEAARIQEESDRRERLLRGEK